MRQKANTAIVELIQSKEFKQCIGKIEPAYLQEDLASEVYLALLETEPNKIIELHNRNELRYYAVRIIFNMACSNTSPFYKKFRKHSNAGYTELYNDGSTGLRIDDDIEKETRSCVEYYSKINLDDLFDECEIKDRKKLELLAFSLIDKLYWYDAEILKLYLLHGNYRAIAEEVRIPFTSIFCTVKKAVQELKEKIAKSEVPTDAQINDMLKKIETLLKVV